MEWQSELLQFLQRMQYETGVEPSELQLVLQSHRADFLNLLKYPVRLLGSGAATKKQHLPAEAFNAQLSAG